HRVDAAAGIPAPIRQLPHDPIFAFDHWPDDGASAGAVLRPQEDDGQRMSDGLMLEGVTIRFGGLTAVSDLNLRVNSQELLGLIGPNGAGKTTVFNLITGVYA